MLYATYMFCSLCQLELHEYRLVPSISTDDLTLISANTIILYENVARLKPTLMLESVQIIKQSMLMSSNKNHFLQRCASHFTLSPNQTIELSQVDPPIHQIQQRVARSAKNDVSSTKHKYINIYFIRSKIVYIL